MLSSHMFSSGKFHIDILHLYSVQKRVRFYFIVFEEKPSPIQTHLYICSPTFSPIKVEWNQHKSDFILFVHIDGFIRRYNAQA